MKTIKLITFLILCTVGFLAMGEMSLLNLSSFQEAYYNVDLYFDGGGSRTYQNTVTEDLCNAGEKHNVDFFAVRYLWNTVNLYDTEIIGTPGAIQELKKSGIQEGVNKSLFFESERVRFLPIKEAGDITDLSTWYLVGEEKDYERLCSFKAELIDRYGGGYPGERGTLRAMHLLIIMVWALVYGITLLLTLYENALKRKERMVRVILGDSITGMFCKSEAADAAGYFVILVLSCFATNHLSNTMFHIRWVIGAFLVFQILNLVLNLRIQKVEYKRSISNAYGLEPHIVTGSYVIKAILTIAAIMVVVVNANTVTKGWKLYEQKDFFDRHTEYAFYKLSYGVDSIGEDGKDPIDDVYRQLYQQYQGSALMYADLSPYYNMTYPFILVNRRAFLELCKEFPELAAVQGEVQDTNVSILFPPNIRKGSRDYNNAMEMNDGFFFSEKEYGEWNQVNYSGGIKVEGFHDEGNGYLLKRYANPILLVDNTVYQKDTVNTGYDAYYNYDILYSIPEEQWNHFCKKYKLQDRYISITNAKKQFDFEWMHLSRQMTLTLSIVLFVLFLEVMMVNLILRMVYQLNAVEMAVKKVHGFSIIERNASIIRMTIRSGLTGMIVAIIWGKLTHINVTSFSILGLGAILVILELAFILIQARRIERYRVTSILKGESI